MNKRFCANTALYFLLFPSVEAFSQNVGIGTTAPAGRLHIKGIADVSQLVIDAGPVQNQNPVVRLRSVFGNDRLHIRADSSVNVFLGFNSGRKNAVSPFQGLNNTAVGGEAAQENQTGFNNSALGYRALYANQVSYNTAVGTYALSANTSGEGGTAIGCFALQNNNIGGFNTAVGIRALQMNQYGNHNTAVGNQALRSNKGGYYNVALGTNALSTNETGYFSTAVGAETLMHSTGEQNSAFGGKALHSNTTGINNTAVGGQALLFNTTGQQNVALGERALYHNDVGSNNIGIGSAAGTYPGHFNNTVSIGNYPYSNGWHNQVFIGNTSSTWNGGNVPWSTYSDARVKTRIREDVKGLAFVTRLRPVTYYRSTKDFLQVTGNADSSLNYPHKYDVEQIKFSGFLAQEVEAAAKEAGYDFNGVQSPKSSNQLYSLSYETFVVPLVKAVQEQQVMINQLQSELKALQKQNSELLQRIKQQ